MLSASRAASPNTVTVSSLSTSSTSSTSMKVPAFAEKAAVGGICLLSPTTIPAFPRPRAPTACEVRTWDASSKMTRSKSMASTGTSDATESGLIMKHGMASESALPNLAMRSRIGVFSPRFGLRLRRSSGASPTARPEGSVLRFERLLMSPGIRSCRSDRASASAVSNARTRASWVLRSNRSRSPASSRSRNAWANTATCTLRKNRSWSNVPSTASGRASTKPRSESCAPVCKSRRQR